MRQGASFHFGEEQLTPMLAMQIARGEVEAVLSAKVRERVRKSAQHVEDIVRSDKAVYGVNTGFGPLCTTRISATETQKLQENILVSHAVGVGDPLDDKLVRLMLILKVQSLAQGYSAIQESTLDRILLFLQHNIIPFVPSQGSVGASGDLAPLAHLFLPLIGRGYCMVEGQKTPAAEVLATHDIEPIQLSPKEGLALINGTQFIAAHAALAVDKLGRLIRRANITAAMMIEGLLASVKPFSAELHQLRPFPANIEVARQVRELLQGSEVVASHTNCTRVQDPYSLRCVPQVHGASLAALQHLEYLLEIELNSVTDNPVIFSKDHTISGGNFHGQPLAMALDYACIAAAEIGNIADRRIYLSLEGDVPGVPKLLMKSTGTNSGFMIPQYTTAALVSENKGLCFPASADSIPTSLGQEDHVSMGSISGRKLLQVIGNCEKIIGIELFCAAQALDFHRPLQSAEAIAFLHEKVREQIPHLEEDVEMEPLILAAIELVRDDKLFDELISGQPVEE
jgi:histidine ammonia-lyase